MYQVKRLSSSYQRTNLPDLAVLADFPHFKQMKMERPALCAVVGVRWSNICRRIPDILNTSLMSCRPSSFSASENSTLPRLAGADKSNESLNESFSLPHWWPPEIRDANGFPSAIPGGARANFHLLPISDQRVNYGVSV